MIIDRIEAIPLRIPFKPGNTSAAAAWGDKDQAAADSLLVKITTEEGLIGWGETFGFGVVPATKAAVDTMIAPLLLRRDASQIAPLMLELQKKLHIFGRSGPIMYGISAVDIALWDMAGKSAEAPVHRLMGGIRETHVPAYASLMRFTEPKVARQHRRDGQPSGS